MAVAVAVVACGGVRACGGAGLRGGGEGRRLRDRGLFRVRRGRSVDGAGSEIFFGAAGKDAAVVCSVGTV